MFHIQEKQIQAAFRDCVRSQFGVEADIAIEQPKQASFGELALPVAFQLAKTLKQAPKKIAADLVAAVGRNSRRGRHGNRRQRLHQYPLRPRSLCGFAAASAAPKRLRAGNGKTIVEHTNINPNKAAHIGHLRNAVLGDTFVRMLRALGHQVEVQNYIDNTGVQVADVVVGFHYLERQTPARGCELLTRTIRRAPVRLSLLGSLRPHFAVL